MNRSRYLTTAGTIIQEAPIDAELALDDLCQQACRGDEEAQHVLAHELYGLLVLEAAPHVDGPEAEGIAEQVLEMIAEGRIRARTRPRVTLAVILRIAGMLARDKAR
jgi:hypothetical protein